MSDWLQTINEVVSFHSSQQDRLGLSPPGRRKKKSGWSIRDTAKFFQKSANWIHQCLKIHKFLETNQEIKPKSRNDAWKIVKDAR